MVRPQFLRTPDHRFENLPDFDYVPNYVELGDVRVHYIDEGDGELFLLLHGEPSWSFLYRKMIKGLVDSGFRVIAPDLIGFGRSDKPKSMKQHTYQGYVDWMTGFVDKLELDKINLFVQDWGGLIGLRVAANRQDKISRIAAGNTSLPHAGGLMGMIGYRLFKRRVKSMGQVTEQDLLENTSFTKWVAYSQSVDDMPISRIIQGATTIDLSEDILRAYDAPFPDKTYKAGPHVMPSLVPSQLRTNQRIWDKVYLNWTKPFLLTFSDKDPITRNSKKQFEEIPAIQWGDHVTIRNAAHFLQEDKGEEIVSELVKFVNKT